MKSRCSAAILAALVVSGVALIAQSPSPQTSTPVFRTGVDTVEVDAIVTARDGTFVRGLTLDDFEVLQDGKKQPLSLVTLVEHPMPSPTTAPPAIDAEPDVATNAGVNEGRLYVVVLDGLHVLPADRVKAVSVARLFVEKYLAAGDMMAVLHIGGTAPYSQEFTRNRARLLQSIERFRGGNDLPSESNSIQSTSEATSQTDPDTGAVSSLLVADLFEGERAEQATRSLDTLKQIATRLGTVRGRRKSLIFISEGYISPIGSPQSQGDPFDFDGARTRNYTDQIEIALQDATRAATLNDVTIYTVDPRGQLTAGGGGEILTSDETLAQAREDARQVQSMRDVAGLTGGTAIVSTNNIAAGLQRVVAENSAYYVLAFSPMPLPHDGKLHKVDVRVKTKGLTVKARRGYIAPSSAPPPTPPAKTGMSAETFEAMKRPVPVAGLSMQMFAASFRKDDKLDSVLIGTELQGKELNLANNAPLEVSYAMIDNQGKVRASRTLNISANLRADTRTRAEDGGLRVLQRLDVPPGRYQIRIAAFQPGSATGSVVYDVDVPNFSTTIGVSSVVLTSRAISEGATIVADADLRGDLPAPPGALRTFAKDDQLTVLTEVYDNRQTPGELLVNASVTTPDGDVVKKVPLTPISGSDRPRYIATVPLDGYAPGKYVLIVDARAQANAQAVLAPPVPFSVK
ncbi:MAG TPA: VWA domain-containing protein [Vicinamibacterales bacterium]|jgi:VWFA-related protein|nr:VWA domain-containing protein [Vicinamibacterales bacterium]